MGLQSSPHSPALPRVVIDLEKLRYINCGLGRFSLYLAREILAAGRGRIEPVLFLPRAARDLFAAEAPECLVVRPWKKEAVAGLVRPLVQPFLGPRRFDLWHVTNQMSKYLPLDARVPVLLTIHDLNFLHEAPAEGRSSEEREREAERKLADIQRKVDRAAAIATVSRFVADDIRARLVLHGRPVHVVHNGLAAAAAASATRPPWAPTDPFLLTVGNCLPHKNFHALFELLDSLPEARLVIAGKKSTPYGEFLEQEAARRGLTPRVTMPGEVSDGDRQWLYEHCRAFLFPSLTEGFGLPVIEALQCGKPVFVSRRTSLPEVAGDLGFYWDSFEPDAMLAVYREGIARDEADPGAAGRRRDHARLFSWQRTAEEYLRIYADLLHAAGSGRAAG
jgi:glycosyltransferase involved in cell wall biosynthesis